MSRDNIGMFSSSTSSIITGSDDNNSPGTGSTTPCSSFSDASSYLSSSRPSSYLSPSVFDLDRDITDSRRDPSRLLEESSGHVFNFNGPVVFHQHRAIPGLPSLKEEDNAEIEGGHPNPKEKDHDDLCQVLALDMTYMTNRYCIMLVQPQKHIEHKNDAVIKCWLYCFFCLLPNVRYFDLYVCSSFFNFALFELLVHFKI